MVRTFALIGLLLSAATAQAALDEQLQYNYVQPSYYVLNPDDAIHGHGKGVDGSIPWKNAYFVAIRFRDPDNGYAQAKDDVEERTLFGGEAGVGHYRAITDTLHWSVAAMFHRRDAEKDGSFADEGWTAGDETGGGLHFGLRHLVTPSLEWGAELATVYVHGNEVHRFAYLQWHLNHFLSVGVKAIRMQDEELQSGYLRISF